MTDRTPPATAAEGGVAIAAGPPLDRAVWALEGRAVNHPRRGWRLDGRPATVQMVLEAANAVLAAGGYPLIAYPGVAEIQRKRRAWA